jgi:hypothetical protein
MSKATENWQKVARILAAGIVFGMDDNVIQTGDAVLTARINALVKSGRLEIRGTSAFEMRSSEVRLPKAR